jgi:peptidoglycan/xylan/chitin deacetylase (PgdA/CDA1 family)
VHALALAAAIRWPEAWQFALTLVVANQIAITAAGLWPRSSLLGPNWTCLPATAGATVALSIDDGPDPEVTPAVLDLLAREGVAASFFCIAARARQHPGLVVRMVAEGHAVENHSAEHRHHFALLGPRGCAAEIGRGQSTLAELAGTAPRFFRAPAGLRNPFLEPALCRLGLTLASWSRRGFDTRDNDPQRVLARLTRELRAGDILLLHDGNAARTRDGTPLILAVLPELIARIRAAGLGFARLRDIDLLRLRDVDASRPRDGNTP